MKKWETNVREELQKIEGEQLAKLEKNKENALDRNTLECLTGQFSKKQEKISLSFPEK